MADSKEIKTPLQWYQGLFNAVQSTKCRLKTKEAEFENALSAVRDLFINANKKNKSVWWVGNGGSSAICSHLAQDVMNKLDIRSLYVGDTSLMTCMANDFGYENVYSRPLAKLSESGDTLIAISSSGNSENILSCVRAAQEKGMNIITLSGMNETNKLWNSENDVSFFVTSDLYGIVEMGHEAILHGIIEVLWLELSRSK